MDGTGNKRPTLKLKWELLPGDGSGVRALAFTSAKPKAGTPAGPRPGNAIAVGDALRLELESDMDGYLHFFDFGTSGKIAKLFPCAALATVDNRIEAGRTYTAPGTLLPIGEFRVSGPTTAESGRKERLFVVVTRRPADLSPAAVERAGTEFAARGGFAAAEEAVESLADLPEDEWTYGLLETEVVHG